MRMKKILLFAILCLMSIGTWADNPTDYFSVSELKLMPGGDAGYVDITLHGSQIYTGYQMDIELPIGMSVATTDKGVLRVSRITTMWPKSTDPDTGEEYYSHALSFGYGDIGKRVLRVMCTSSESKSFTKKDGVMFRVFLKANIYTKAGKADIRITNAVLTATNASLTNTWDVHPEDASFKTVIVDTPATLPINITSANKWSTALVPFSASVPEGMRAFSCGGFTGEEERYLVLNEVKDFTAYQPYLLYAKDGFTGSVSGYLEESLYPETSTVNADSYLRSSLEPIDISEGYILQNQGSIDGAMFYTIFNETFTLPEGKCWLIRPAKEGMTDAKCIGFYFANDVTNIGNISVNKKQTNGNLYTLDGKLVKSPTVGNIYIKDGKKVFKLK